MVHNEFLSEGQTVKAAIYVDVLKRLKDRVRRVRQHLSGGDGWLLHQDDVPAHSVVIV